jgi:hypothetical protein
MQNMGLYGLYTPITATISPAPAQALNIAVIGDSWTEGTGGIFSQLGGYAFSTALALGCKMPFICGQGGTGYTTANDSPNTGDEAFGSLTRLASVFMVASGTALPSSGTFNFTWNGITSTTTSSYNDSTASMLAAINAIPGLTGVTVANGPLVNTGAGNGGRMMFIPPAGISLAALRITNSTMNGGAISFVPVLPYNIDLGIVLGSVNDSSSSGVATSAANMYSFLAGYYPSTRWIIAGVQPSWTNSLGNQSATHAACNTALATAVANAQASGYPFLGFIDMFSSPWLSGTGYFLNPTGDGNDDFDLISDHVHPSYAGHQMFARRLAQSIASILGAW